MYYPPEVKTRCEAIFNNETALGLMFDKLVDMLTPKTFTDVIQCRHEATDAMVNCDTAALTLQHPWIKVRMDVYVLRLIAKLYNLSGSLDYLKTLLDAEKHMITDYVSSVLAGMKVVTTLTSNKHEAEDVINGVLGFDDEYIMRALVIWETALDCESQGEFTAKTPLYSMGAQRLREHFGLPVRPAFQGDASQQPYSRIATIAKEYVG